MSYRGSRRTISQERTRSEALEYRCPSAGHYASTCGVSFNDQATALMLRAGFVNLRFGRFRLSKNLTLGRQLSGLSSASRLLYRPLGGHKSRWTSTACLEKASGNRTTQVVSTGGRSRLTGSAHDQQCGERLCDQTCCSEPRMPRLDSEQAARSSLYSGKLQFDGLCIQVPMLNTEIWCTIADVIERIDSAC